MHKDVPVEKYINIAIKNKNAYLNSHSMVDLKPSETAHNTVIIDRYLDCITEYRNREASELDSAVAGPTLGSQVGHGIVSMLLGAGIGAGAFVSQQRVPSVDMFGVKASAQAGFSALIAASSSALISATWEKLNQKPLAIDREAFEKQLHASGFGKKYDKLATDLVELFHFRECLLLDLPDSSQVKMRLAFKNRYCAPPYGVDFNDKDFDLAIEIYFLQELNKLFHTSFEQIYAMHQAELDTEALPVIGWFKKHLETSKNRQKFTQQIQINFISQCIHYLETEMNQTGFWGKYSLLMASIGGLIAGALTLGVIAILNPFLPLIALISIGLVATTTVAIAMNALLTGVDAIYYKRQSTDRNAIRDTIQKISSEKERLVSLTRQVVDTSPEQVKQLEQFKAAYHPNISCFFSQSHVALGNWRAWIREYISRYHDNELTVTDLHDDITALVKRSYKQTHEIQKELVLWAKLNRVMILNKLHGYINDTEDFLQNIENEQVIQDFNLLLKIREQVLEFISYVPIEHALPEKLVNFYTTSLHGLTSDLEQARRLTPILPPKIPADINHPYYKFLTTAEWIDNQFEQLPESEQNLVCRGDRFYRKLLGLPQFANPPINEQTPGSFDAMLNSSFIFLCSLNQYSSSWDWDQPFEHSDAYLIYRLLLVKQLAVWFDENNMNVSETLKGKIATFAYNTLHYRQHNPFSDITSQSLLHGYNQDTRTIPDPVSSSPPHQLTDLNSIADAIRAQLAQDVNPLSVKQLMTTAADRFLISTKQPQHILLGINSPTKVQDSAEFLKKIQAAIKCTQMFMETIKSNELLKLTKSITVYQNKIHKEIDDLIDQSLKMKNDVAHHKTQVLDGIINALQTFKHLSLEPVASANRNLSVSREHRRIDGVAYFSLFPSNGKKQLNKPLAATASSPAP
jgi:uncharacterized membrane protein YfcA